MKNEPVIRVQNVSKDFGQERVLHSVSRDFASGMIHGIVGNNGSGKTVLMKCICGFLFPTEGRVLVNGKEVGRDVDFPPDLGIIIETPGFLQWPCTGREHPGTPIMHVGKFARGLGWLYPTRYQPPAEMPDSDYPFCLMTGRILYHYTTRAMTGRTPGLMEIEGSSFIEMNEKDADRLGIANGEKIRVSSRRGSVTTSARVGTRVNEGETWMPFHFPDGNANWLTNAALDPKCRIPEYKVCAVRIEKMSG